MSADVDRTDAFDIKGWIHRLVSSWPQVEGILLVGSRALGYARLGSDWDIIVALRDACYENVPDGC